MGFENNFLKGRALEVLKKQQEDKEIRKKGGLTKEDLERERKKWKKETKPKNREENIREQSVLAGPKLVKAIKEQKREKPRTMEKALAILAAAGISIGVLMSNFSEKENLVNKPKSEAQMTDQKQKDRGSLETDEQNYVDEQEAKDYDSTPEQVEIDEQNIQSINDVFNFASPDKIVFNHDTTIALKNYWINKYKTDEKLKKSFDKGYAEMQNWRPYLEEIFDNNGVPKKYLFLAIPESHWQTEAVSRTQAVGPYQFMRRTAHSYGLTMDKFVDQRKDPLASAEACAKLLKDNYQATGDWDLAVAAYNWGETWKYKKEAKTKEEKATFDGYCQYAEKQINDIKNELLNKKITKTGARLKFLNVRKRAFMENLNYPSKFWAIDELIKEKEVLSPPDKDIAKIDFAYRKIEQPKNRYSTHTVKKGENARLIARSHHVNLGDLYNANHDLKKKARNLPVGANIEIPDKKAKLIFIKNITSDINRIKYLNPALAKSVLENKAPIPDNYKLRF